ncbi:MAG: TRAM domain-containing protein [Coriobacteriales bacterium]|nr:TRAM domain-containing protein [Coriobacteriales bacterium]
MLAGKSERNQTVHAPLLPGARLDDHVGRILPVRIEEARTWYLRGELELV